jgi:hypothetical protein
VLRTSEETADTKRAIDGLSNKDQINKYLKDPSKMPDPKDTLKDKLED